MGISCRDADLEQDRDVMLEYDCYINWISSSPPGGRGRLSWPSKVAVVLSSTRGVPRATPKLTQRSTYHSADPL